MSAERKKVEKKPVAKVEPKKRVEPKPVPKVEPKKRTEVQPKAKAEVQPKVEPKAEVKPKVEKKVANSFITESSEPKPKKSENKYVRIALDAKAEDKKEFSEKVQKGELKLAYYAIDNDKGYHYYLVIKK